VGRWGDRARAGIEAYKQRWKRRRLLLRAWRARRDLTPVVDRTARVAPGDILGFLCVRNEGARLPYFLAHHRRLGVRHFFIVDNGSDDGSADWLAGEADVSLWHASGSYRDSRFGMDWLGALLLRHGPGHWCLTLDADEILIYPDWQARDLRELTAWLDARGVPAFAAMMLDLYPKGPLSTVRYQPGQDPALALPFFDPGPYDRVVQPRYGQTDIRGGVRRRVFFADAPNQAPHLHKLPLVKWQRQFAYLSSTHIALPRRLNRGFSDAGLPTGVLLHTKFLPEVLEKSAEEKTRHQHFTHVEQYGSYYDLILSDPGLWSDGSQRYEGWQQLHALHLMQGGDWLAR
jgi:glycosyltransferase involved in cell wall biosynthesis